MENYANGESDYFNGGLVVLGSSSPTISPLLISSPPSASVTPVFDGRVNCILHTVSKFDTLAGVAIKYGVEVADIKKLNGLVTDLQMFALKTLRIPLPGRHPPSPILSIGHETQGTSSSEQSQSSRRHSDLFDSFQSLKLKSCSKHKASGSMSNLQGDYGLNIPADQNHAAESCEMAVYRSRGDYYLEDGPPTNPPLSHHRKSRSLANGFGSINGDLINPLLSQDDNKESDGWFMKLLGRNEKPLADLNTTSEKLLKKESSTSSSLISPVTGKGLALRPAKSGNQNQNVVVGSVDYSLSESSSTGVRKSLSTPSLQQDTESGGALSSLWQTSKWSLKPDFQALSNAAIGIPIFDGLPKHMGRRNKAALD